MAVKACWVEVSKAERSELEGWLRSQTIAQGLAQRARVVLGSANGESIRELAQRLEVSQPTVCLWRRRFREFGIGGLKSRPRSGRRRRISPAQERAVVSATMRPPKTATHWSAQIDGKMTPDVAWSYDAPLAESVPIAGLLSFYSERTTMLHDVLMGFPVPPAARAPGPDPTAKAPQTNG